MITSLIEMLNLPNFSRIITSTIYIESRDKFCWWRHGKEQCCKFYFKIPVTLRKPTVAVLADIIKIATMFIKTTFKDLKKL